ncbi:MAG: DUF1013 domain-containing protein [Alphaproteobacteria bacterium]|nr:DUF1013 domain-containing protein [Alphaproteobacteria bacterium]
MAALPLMPKATAVWLVEHTTLTFEQVAEYCGLHKLEVQAIADGEVAIGIVGMDPIFNGQLTQEEIKRCEADPRARLKMTKSDLPAPISRTKGARYTPVSKRGEKPDAIAYLIKNHPELLDAQVARLLGTTKETIAKVRDRSHWNATNIKPHNPVLLGLVKQTDLDAALKRASRRVERENKAKGIVTPKPEAAAKPDANQPEGFVQQSSDEQQPDIDHDAMMRSIG